MADDPTYPFRPIVALFCAACLLYMLTMNILRQSWNLGVFFLCFWMFFDNVTSGANAVVWADNADIRAHVYCDIVSHLRVFVAVVRPACTLILTRRLYKIASLRSFDAENPLERRFDLVFEWGLGAVLPTIVTGVFYYIVQDARFQVIGSIGCFDTFSSSGLSLILVEGWTILFPAISVFFYCPRIFYVFYHHSQATRRILQSTHVTSNKIYLRLLAIGSLDIAITLPIGIVNVITTVKDVDSFPFYVGWTAQHSNWAPYSVTYAEVLSAGFWDKFEFYFEIWTTPVLSIAIIAIFGLTADGGAMWRRGVRFLKEFVARAGMVRAPAKTQLSDLHFHHTTGLSSLTELRAASTSTDVMRISIPLHTFASDPESKAIVKD